MCINITEIMQKHNTALKNLLLWCNLKELMQPKYFITEPEYVKNMLLEGKMTPLKSYSTQGGAGHWKNKHWVWTRLHPFLQEKFYSTENGYYIL